MTLNLVLTLHKETHQPCNSTHSQVIDGFALVHASIIELHIVNGQLLTNAT